MISWGGAAVKISSADPAVLSRPVHLAVESIQSNADRILHGRKQIDLSSTAQIGTPDHARGRDRHAREHVGPVHFVTGSVQSDSAVVERGCEILDIGAVGGRAMNGAAGVPIKLIRAFVPLVQNCKAVAARIASKVRITVRP